MGTTNREIWNQVRELEMRDHAADAVFRTIAGRVALTDEEFQYHRNRLKILKVNRMLAECPRPWQCEKYLTCVELRCTLPPFDEDEQFANISPVSKFS